MHADYFGLNHCGWIHRVLVDGVDRLPEIVDRFEEARQAMDEQWGLVDPGLVRLLGMLPMEYLYFYYYRDLAVGHIQGSGGSRGRELQALNDALWPDLRAAIDAGDLARARGAWERAMAERDATYFARERGEVSTRRSRRAGRPLRRGGLRGRRDRGDDGSGPTPGVAVDPERAEPRRDPRPARRRCGRGHVSR